jgi:predicted GTPase
MRAMPATPQFNCRRTDWVAAKKRDLGTRRYLESMVCERFGFKGTPIWFKVRARNAEKKDG